MKHESVRIVPESKFSKNVKSNAYKFHENLIDKYEFCFKRTSFKLNIPIHVVFVAYQLAKLRMLQFYYNCLDLYFDRKDFQYIEMDTVSAYIAITAEKLEDIIKPELKEQFKQNREQWFGRINALENKLYD